MRLPMWKIEPAAVTTKEMKAAALIPEHVTRRQFRLQLIDTACSNRLKGRCHSG
ncbi:hypothetical protein [Phyllobacterium sp. SB3]|uniref:hypothetical protein n=1 Tax=Phyllobacterium sp. SB3 TaxID=3156073 RepID=UPI0032AEA534